MSTRARELMKIRLAYDDTDWKLVIFNACRVVMAKAVSRVRK